MTIIPNGFVFTETGEDWRMPVYQVTHGGLHEKFYKSHWKALEVKLKSFLILLILVIMIKDRIKSVKSILINLFFCPYPILTIWLNYKLLPFSQAIRLPIFLYSKTHFRDLSGKVIINCDNIRPNMIKIGCQWWYPSTSVPLSVWSIFGEIEFSGPISFAQGTYLLVAQNGRLHFGTNGAVVGTNAKIICFDSIYLGDNVQLTWDCQLYDTSFHYVEFDRKIPPLTKPIIIGSDSWIGNHTTITKGTVLPNHSIVCSHSLVNKDFSGNGEYCMFAGVPANLKRENITRIFDQNIEQQLDEKYNYSRNHL